MQSGFRQSFSTDNQMCSLTHLSDLTLKNQDKSEYTGMVVIDLQKAFDTVSHTILVSKLRALGLDQIAIKRITSYLEDQEQIVDIAGTHSDSQNINSGVP